VERAEWSFYTSYLKEGMVVFDVGAYIGELTLLFSRFVGEKGRVHAFEACSPNSERLMAVCRAAMRHNIVINHVALADKEGLADLHVYDSQHLSWCSLAERPLEKYGIHVRPERTEKVVTMTIDAYCQKNGISQIDLLKVDVEGAEYQVLLGARKMLQDKRIRCCVFEFGQTTFDMGNNPDDIEAYLTGLRYRLRNMVKGNPVFPGRASAKTARFSMHVATPR
jgi:FkbM family methyltransferase